MLPNLWTSLEKRCPQTTIRLLILPLTLFGVLGILVNTHISGTGLEHLRWRRTEWDNNLFSDESRFRVQPDNRRIIIWRERGTRNNPEFVNGSVRFGGGGVMAWEDISINGCTELYIIRNGSLTAQRFLTTSLDTCFPKSNIVFLKTHKCAGSSIQNILMRYGDVHQLNFVLPKKGNYLGHPAPFSRTMVLEPRLPTYNILAHHTRLDFHEIRSLMPRNSIYITIVRDPIEVFESSYSYYGLGSVLGGNLHKFIARVPTLQTKFLHKRYRNKFGTNQMMFDLGADPAIFSNDSLVKQYIDKLESWFHFVLIADRMDESLVLLRHLLCWEIDDVVSFKLNARDPKFKSSLEEHEKKVLKSINHADVLLYNNFLERFEKAIDVFGRDRMAEETQQLRDRTQKWYKLCVKTEQRHSKPTAKPKYYFNSKVMVFQANSDVSNSTCKAMTIEELPYTDLLRQRQQTRVLKRLGPALLSNARTQQRIKSQNKL